MKTIFSLKYFVSYCNLSSNATVPSHQPPYIQINELIGLTDGFYLLIKEILKTLY